MCRILLTKQADKTLRKIPKNWSQRIREKIVQIAENLYGQYNNVTKLQDRLGFRLQVGDWRVIYEIEEGQVVILVLEISPQGGAYQ